MSGYGRWPGVLWFLTLCIFAPAAQAAPEALSKVKAAIVAVGTYQAARSPSFQFRGTGFAVDDGHTIVTNAHVIDVTLDEAHQEKLVVAQPLGEGRVAVQETRLRANDPAHDLALLRIARPLPPLTVGDSDVVREGRLLWFTGFPIGTALGLVPATHRAMIAAMPPIALPQVHASQLSPAMVRQLGREPFTVFQLDATAYPGNSGSPLFDPESGAVLGVINMAFVKNSREAMLTQPSGITYAIPAEHLRALLDEPAY